MFVTLFCLFSQLTGELWSKLFYFEQNRLKSNTLILPSVNGKLIYPINTLNLSCQTSSKFIQTGREIRIHPTATLDYEKCNKYEILLADTAKKGVILSNITLNVNAVDEYAPRIVGGANIKIKLRQSIQVDTAIGQVRVQDDDLGSYFSYKVESEFISIGSDGTIFLKRVPLVNSELKIPFSGEFHLFSKVITRV